MKTIDFIETDIAAYLRIALLFVMLLSGCADDMYDQSHEYLQGWRIGEIQDVGISSTIFPIARLDCRSRAAKQGDTWQGYAYVVFDFSPTGRGFYHASRHAIVAVPDSMAIKKGDEVYVNMRDCGKTIASLKFW